jgi:hypothetical protein
MQKATTMLVVSAVLLVAISGAEADYGRRGLQQVRDPNAGTTITVNASSALVNAIAITPALPYPQTGIFCNISGDSRFPAAGGTFPLTVRVPVGVTATVVFANITGTIPGTTPGTPPSGGSTPAVQQPGTSAVTQPGTSVVQQPGTSVVQQPGTSVVQQPGTSVVQQPGTSVVQQPGTSVVQQPGTSVVQQPGTSVVQQPGTSVVQQPNTVSNVPPTSVVQQPKSNTGKKLLQLKPAPIEYISNNGSMGQPQLTVLDTTEGVPNIKFTPSAAGQTAQFTGALQVAVTTTRDGFGSPYIPYTVDAKLSPNCGVTVKFVTI